MCSKRGGFECIGSAISRVDIELLSSYLANWVGGLQTEVEIRCQGQVQCAVRRLLATAVYAAMIM